MTTGPVPRVDISSLSIQGELGSGGQGRVLAVDGFRINGQWPAALKAYSHSIVAALDTAALETIVGFASHLSQNDRAWLDQNTAWPSVIVEDKGTVCGFLMRRLPQAFYFNFQTQVQGTRQKPADIAFLLNSDNYVRSSGLSISDGERLALLENLAATLSRLHSMNVAVGDMSPKNILFSLTPAPSCFIIDCDAMRVQGQSALPQVHTEDWKLPEGEPKATPAADAYKFGLLAIRLFARDQVSTDRTALTALSPNLGRFATDSLHLEPSRRPALGQWIPALTAARNALQSAPTATFQRPGSLRISVPVPTVSPGSPPHSTRRPSTAPAPRPRGNVAKLLAFAGLGLIVLVVTIIGLNASHSSNTGSFSANNGSGGSASGAPSSQSAPSDSQSAPSAQPTSVGAVSIGNSISGDSAATAVAGMFNTYFTGINSRNYQQALSVFDPNGVINPNDSNQVQHFSSGVSTSSDSGMTLVNITPSDGSPVQSAEVQFTSHQQAGYGPQDDPSATCTNWDVTYTLSQGSSGNYLINNVSKSTDSAC